MAQRDDILETRNKWKKRKETYLRKYDPMTGLSGAGAVQMSQPGEIMIYGALGKAIEAQCKTLLKYSKIPHQTSNRVKTFESFDGKVHKSLSAMFDSPDFKNAEDEVVYQRLDEKIRDRAGVRILLYIPDDVGQVAELIRKSHTIEVHGAALSFTKSRRYDPKGDPSGYVDGPFFSEEGVSPDTIKTEWKHSGYRAAHLHVRLKQEARELALSTVNAEYPGVSFEQLIAKSAEIQLTTVVMHAWSQVEHDIVYKMASGMVPSENINRMLDGVNGLSITSEILLKELSEQNTAREKMAAGLEKRKFEDTKELHEWLSTYHAGLDKWDWKDSPEYPNLVLAALQSRDNRRAFYRDDTRASLGAFIKKCRLLQSSPRETEKLDLSVRLLRAFTMFSCGTLWPPDDRQKGDMRDTIFQSTLYNLLLVANAFSIMVALEESQAIHMLKSRFDSQGVESIRQINGIFTSTLLKPVNVEKLRVFARQFLEADWCETHDLAVALSKFHFLTAHNCKWRKGSLEEGRDISQPHFEQQYGPVQAVLFCLRDGLSPAPQVDIRTTSNPFESSDKTHIPRIVTCCYDVYSPDQRRNESEVITHDGGYSFHAVNGNGKPHSDPEKSLVFCSIIEVAMLLERTIQRLPEKWKVKARTKLWTGSPHLVEQARAGQWASAQMSH